MSASVFVTRVPLGAAALLIALLAWSPSDATTVRDQRFAYQLGFYYGVAHVGDINQAMSSETGRHHMHHFLDLAAKYAAELGINIDPTPPSELPQSYLPHGDAIQTALHLADLVALQLEATTSRNAAQAMQFGYRSTLIVLSLPYLAADAQAEVAAGVLQAAGQLSFPREPVEIYLAKLRSSIDETEHVEALFDFKEAMLAFFESKEESADASVYRHRLTAWRLGHKLGLVALGKTRGADPVVVDRMFAEARALAHTLDLALPALPETPTDTAKDTAAALHYLFEAGNTIGGRLEANFGPAASATFELALKSKLILILYGPEEGGMGGAFADVVERAGGKSGLPPDVYMPLLRQLQNQAPYEEVRAEVIQLSDKVETVLGRRLSLGDTE